MVGTDSQTQDIRGTQVPRTLQPADFADRIRALARDAGRIFRSRDANPGELIELSRRIDELRQQTKDSLGVDIDRWLRSAQNLIRVHMRPAAEAESDITLH